MPILNELFRSIRWNKASARIKPRAIVLDIGSGEEARFLFHIKGKIQKGIGLDYRTKKFKEKKIEVRRFIVKEKLPFKAGSFDHVVMLAMIEHLKHPEKILKECHRVLKRGGTVIISCPTPQADAILHVLLKLKSPFLFSDEEEASKHETCFTALQLRQLAASAGFRKILIEPFEFGLNTLMVAYK